MPCTVDYTEANLLRVSDVLAEQGTRMNSLKRQVSKARRYKSLAEDARILDHLGHKRYVEFVAERDELKTSIRSWATEVVEQLMEPKEEAVADARLATHLRR